MLASAGEDVLGLGLGLEMIVESPDSGYGVPI